MYNITISGDLVTISNNVLQDSNFLIKSIFLLWCLLTCSCHEEDGVARNKYNYIDPQYNLVQLSSSTDTLHFPLDDNTYNAIKSANVFLEDSTEYIYFHDRRSESVNIYHLQSKNQVKRILLKNCFLDRKLYKTSVYVKNFDSIFIVNKATLHMLDSSGVIKQSFDFLESPPLAFGFIENSNPPIFKDTKLYTGVRPYVRETSLKALKKWKVLYEFNLQSKETQIKYHLPEIYQKNLYGYHFLKYSYCYNDKGNFVFSFAADINVYETNLVGYHMSYYGKSQFQDGVIQPLSKEDISNDEGFKNFMLRDSYGPIYFDYFRKRYLRVAMRKINEDAYQSKNSKKQSVIIFDDHLRIIGESQVDDEISLNSLFFTSNGYMYARVNVRDEYALHFIRLEYFEKESKEMILSKKRK